MITTNQSTKTIYTNNVLYLLETMVKKCNCGFADFLYRKKRISKQKHDSMCKKFKAKCMKSKRRKRK